MSAPETPDSGAARPATEPRTGALPSAATQAAGEPVAGAAPADAVASESTAGPRVEFYVIEDSTPTARLKLACKLAEKAFLADQRVLVWHTDPDELRQFDDLLWTFADRSFVPHEVLGPTNASNSEAPVLLTSGVLPTGAIDILINLAPEVPACADRAPRIAEIIDGDDGRRRAGRARFKTYRDRGVQPVTHNLRGE